MDVPKIAQLANLTLTQDEEALFAKQFKDTLLVVDQLKEIDTTDIKFTSEVTKLKNVTRPDVVDRDRILTQAEALANAKHTYKGYFVVKQVIDKND